MIFLFLFFIFFPLNIQAEEQSAWDIAHEPAVKDPGKVTVHPHELTRIHEHEERFDHDRDEHAERREFSHHHSHEWHPQYNYYKHHYHVYPYVYVSPTVYVSSPTVPVTTDNSTYYYDQGTFYENRGQQYAPTAPPVGTLVPSLPPGCAQIVVGNQTYCVFNGVYYQAVAGGYKVVEPVHQ